MKTNVWEIVSILGLCSGKVWIQLASDDSKPMLNLFWGRSASTGGRSAARRVEVATILVKKVVLLVAL